MSLAHVSQPYDDLNPDVYQPDRVCSLGLAITEWSPSMRLEVGVTEPRVVEMVLGLLKRERQIICYNDDYASWCVSMGQLVVNALNAPPASGFGEVWTKFEGDRLWAQSTVWQDLDLGRAVLNSLYCEGALIERTHTELRTGIFTRRYYVVDHGLEAWAAARFLQLEEGLS